MRGRAQLPSQAARWLPPFALYAGLSLVLHAAALATTFRHEGRAAAPAPSFEPAAGALVGETLDVEPPSEAVDLDDAPASVGAKGEATAPAPVEAPRVAGPGAPRGSRAASAAAAAPASAPALFGAVGVRFATDLATTFTRGFPQAASADAIWTTAPVGPAGTAEVTLTVDESGHLVSTAIKGSPSPALRRGIERTLVLLGARTFTARGAVTRLRITARVATNDVHDGLHGDVFALSGGSFAGEVGTAFFALPPSNGPGRRIDLELRLLP